MILIEIKQIIFKFSEKKVEMSLSLLKRELQLASEEKEETSNKKKSKTNHLGTERHGMKKKKKMLKSQKKKSDKFSFKFSDQDALVQEDKTLQSLEQLASLDKIARKVSFTKIVADISRKKRQTQRSEPGSSLKKEDKSSILLTEEEVASLERAYFLHSKEKRKPKDDWD